MLWWCKVTLYGNTQVNSNYFKLVLEYRSKFVICVKTHFTTVSNGKAGSDLCNKEIHPGQQVDQDQTENKKIIDLWLDRTQESIHGSQGQELPGTKLRRVEEEEEYRGVEEKREEVE